VEQNLEQIFSLLAKYKVRCNIIQNSAISFSFVADNKENKLEKLLAELVTLGLETKTTEALELITIYNANNASIQRVGSIGNIILEQKNGNTIHYLINR
jgi:aspartate kinase